MYRRLFSSSPFPLSSSEPLDLPLELEDWAIINAALHPTLSLPTYLGRILRNNFLLDLYDWAHALPQILLSAD